MIDLNPEHAADNFEGDSLFRRRRIGHGRSIPLSVHNSILQVSIAPGIGSKWQANTPLGSAQHSNRRDSCCNRGERPEQSRESPNDSRPLDEGAHINSYALLPLAAVAQIDGSGGAAARCRANRSTVLEFGGSKRPFS